MRHGARKLLAQAVEAEVADFLAKHAGLKTEDGRKRMVRHGHLPEREVKLVEAAPKSWRRLGGHNQLPKLIPGVKFTDRLEVVARRGDLQPATAA